MKDLLQFSEEVMTARAERRAIVALESTVIAHGLPNPDNLEVAARTEQVIRDQGAVPATVAVMDGKIRIGLSEAERERLIAPGVAKLSRRDLAVTLATGGVGATTVASTMICADLAGISCFATGGIGGVHRGAAESFDISADLHEFTKSPVLTIASGAKNILDLPKTLEVLETLGIPVLGLGTDRFPAFHVRDSGLALDRRVDDPREVARIAKAHWALGLGGILVCNPVPEADALPAHAVEAWIEEALAEAAAQAITGKAVTPFLLRRIAAQSGGRTLGANKALLIDNARQGAILAQALIREFD